MSSFDNTHGTNPSVLHEPYGGEPAADSQPHHHHPHNSGSSPPDLAGSNHTAEFRVDENGVPYQSTTARVTLELILAQRAASFHHHQSQADQHQSVEIGASLQSTGPLQTVKSVAGDETDRVSEGPMASNLSFFNFHTESSDIPETVVKIARQMKGLDEKSFLMLADLTQKKAWKNVYSLLEYRGTSWYLPTLRPIEEDEASCGVGFERTGGVWFALAGWRLELNVVGYLVRAILLVALWLALWTAMPKQHAQFRGFVFDPIVCVLVCAIVGGMLARLLRIPPLVMVLWMGILWNNVPSVGYLTSGIDPYVRKASSTFGLTVILIRAGLYIRPEELKPMAIPYILFSLLPAAAEMICHSFMAKALFNYPNYTWAFAHGSLIAAVAPAVIVPGLLALRLQGFSVTRGPSHIMMPAAPTEMASAIWAINFIATLALDKGDIPLALNIALGPIQIIGGVIVGVILGFVHFGCLKVFLAEARKLPHRNYTQDHMERVALMSTITLVLLGLAVNFYTKSVLLAGGGALAVVFMAITTNCLMRRRDATPYFEEQFRMMCVYTADLWDVFTMPLLFAMVGSNINVREVFTADFFPKMLACIAVGLVARFVFANLAMSREDYDIGERVVACVGWCGKATVQAVLSGVCLERAKELYADVAAISGKAAADENIALAKQINNAGVLAIMICAPFGSIIMVRLGPLFFRKETAGGGH